MLHDTSKGVYVYAYDCLQDTASISDYWFETLEQAEEDCNENYKIENDDWIFIAESLEGCQDDFILPTRIKGKESGNPRWGYFEFYSNGKWRDIFQGDKEKSFAGMTVNERLFLSGLIYEFDMAKKKDKEKARKILEVLRVDMPSINKIV